MRNLNKTKPLPTPKAALIIAMTVFMTGCIEDSSSESQDKSSAPEPDFSILTHPDDANIFESESVTLNVSIEGNTNLEYEWRRQDKAESLAITQDNHWTLSDAQVSDTGSYYVVVRSLSNGAQKTTTRANIDVSSFAAKLSWEPPLERVNGESLQPYEIGAYEMYYDQDIANLTDSQLSQASNYTIEDTSKRTYFIENLPSGTWYFGLKAVDTDGLASEISEIKSKTVN